PPHNVTGRATKYQERIARTFGDAPPAPGQEFQLGGKWFDGVKRSANKLLEAKGEGYAQILSPSSPIVGMLSRILRGGRSKVFTTFGFSV
ncbi:MAG: Tox-REase-5 domain-containing protein, partial [Kiritimatiellae bacterium]|nr:Tox-REase-5 domain-containing protein [Kiritimatiellia bacterium]